ncbi:hypothetical protein [Actinopolyspora mortivallis]|uniref:hypothetical protein n=1 Tax=Actinopolyspora mortivallis TaxID=33906 RepID=UPI000363C0CE|nr:hypothetical protein [Actinopolyspora mortivallis]
MRTPKLVGLFSGTAMAIALLGAAPAAASESPDFRQPQGGGATQAAPDYEWNKASPGTPPSGIPCSEPIPGAIACFEPYGDKYWVKDTVADGHSAAADWDNYRNGNWYRQGGCVNSLGKGNWGVCNKNHYEDSTVVFRTAVYDAGTGTWHDFGPSTTVSAG